jgi:uncharacterized protein DUF3558
MHTRLFLVGVAAVVVAAGCTTTSSGDPTSTPSTSGTSDSANGETDLPSHGAPRVENPLDVGEFEKDPCKSLSSQQAEDLGVPESESEDGSYGNGCRWSASEPGKGQVSMSFFTDVGRGLSAPYEENENGDFKLFKELPKIEGYPAVAYDTVDENPTEICAIAVGVSDHLAFDVHLRLSAKNVGQLDPCDKAAMVVEMMLKNMKGE